jgi:hypothetical protein
LIGLSEPIAMDISILPVIDAGVAPANNALGGHILKSSGASDDMLRFL